jgi:diguanylate cyclase (GGDEF)-like protein
MVARLRHGREELERLAVTDDLTGLHNRKHLDRRLADEIARSDRYEHPFVMMMIDVDHFKNYNDTWGHQAGDDVLRRVASVFTLALRDVDYCARYGGEEFFALLPQTPLTSGAGVAERVRATAEEVLGGEEENAPVTVSVGIAEYPNHGATAEALVEAADRALYVAKEKGRNRVVPATVHRAKAASATPKKSDMRRKSGTRKTAGARKTSGTTKTKSTPRASSTTKKKGTTKTSSTRKKKS